jgi:membrane protease YdiL (CAAX protease family)
MSAPQPNGIPPAHLPPVLPSPDAASATAPSGAWAHRFSDHGRRLLIVEVSVVLALSLGQSGVYALVNLIATATAPGQLSDHRAVMNGSLAPGRENLDLVLQLLAIAFGIAPTVLVGYLLVRSGTQLADVWFAEDRLAGDVVRGAILAAAIGGAGVTIYLVTHALGMDLTVVAEALPNVWWRIPVLVLAALQNALLEEIVVLGYVLPRLAQIGLKPRVAIVLAALLRGSYHLYQGLGGFFGNIAMGLVFGALYLRWRRITPMIVAHTLLDTFAFVGFLLLAGHVSWLPH